MAQVAEIIEIVAPSEAVAGITVTIRVTIKNIASVEAGIMVGGALEYGPTPWPSITFPNDWANFPPGESYYFEGYFTMPDSDVTIHAYSYWYGRLPGETWDSWHFDNEKTKDVKLTELASDVTQFEISDYVKM